MIANGFLERFPKATHGNTYCARYQTPSKMQRPCAEYPYATIAVSRPLSLHVEKSKSFQNNRLCIQPILTNALTGSVIHDSPDARTDEVPQQAQVMYWRPSPLVQLCYLVNLVSDTHVLILLASPLIRLWSTPQKSASISAGRICGVQHLQPCSPKPNTLLWRGVQGLTGRHTTQLSLKVTSSLLTLLDMILDTWLALSGSHHIYHS